MKRSDGDGGFVCEKRSDDMWAPKNNLGLILGLVFGLLALFGLVGLFIWLWRSGRLKRCGLGGQRRPDFRRNNFSVSRGRLDPRPNSDFREVQSPPRQNRSPSPVSLADARGSHQRSRSLGASTRVPSVFWDDYSARDARETAQSRRVIGGGQEPGQTKVIL